MFLALHDYSSVVGSWNIILSGIISGKIAELNGCNTMMSSCFANGKSITDEM